MNGRGSQGSRPFNRKENIMRRIGLIPKEERAEEPEKTLLSIPNIPVKPVKVVKVKTVEDPAE